MKKTIGISTANGYPFLTLRERYTWFSKSGFQSIMLWWGEDEREVRSQRVALAEEYHLRIENVHADMENSNSLWVSGASGDEKAKELIQAVVDCKTFGIQCMVIHLTNGNEPPGISDFGLRRMEKIFSAAKKHEVTLAIENVRIEKHIRYLLDHCHEKHIGFCLDTGHSNIWCKDTDWLSLYGDRLAAVHLHDNNGVYDEHAVPFSGTLNWNELIYQLSKSSYHGALTLETEYRGDGNPEYLEKFLKDSYNAGIRLLEMV
jgi:sugar phosphate isomerase/epimerase